MLVICSLSGPFPGCAGHLCNRLQASFFPALLGRPVSETEACLFSLPACIGDLGISDLVGFASSACSSSREGIVVLVDCIKEILNQM